MGVGLRTFSTSISNVKGVEIGLPICVSYHGSSSLLVKTEKSTIEVGVAPIVKVD
jgi:hypothetical protein